MADEDTVSDVEDIEQTGSTDIDEVLLLAFLAFGVVFILAIAFDYKSLAGLGVGEIGSFLSPVQAFFNGLASLITGFFSGLAKDASNLVVLAYITKIKGVYRILIIAVKVVH